MAFPTDKPDLDATRATAGTDKLSSPDHLVHHQREDECIEGLMNKVGAGDANNTPGQNKYLEGQADGKSEWKDEITLGNDKAYQAKDSGGIARNIAKVNISDEIEIGDSNQLLKPVGVKARIWAYRSSNQPYPATTNFYLEFNGEIEKINITHSTTTNPDDFTITKAGRYFIALNLAFTPDANGRLNVRLRVNGTEKRLSAISYCAGGNYSSVTFAGYINLAENDVIDFVCWASVSGNVYGHVTDFNATWVQIERVAEIE